MCDKPKEIREKCPKQAFFPFFGTFKLLAKATKVTSSCLFQVPKVCSSLSLSLSQRHKISLPLKKFISKLCWISSLWHLFSRGRVWRKSPKPLKLTECFAASNPSWLSVSLSLHIYIYIYIYCGWYAMLDGCLFFFWRPNQLSFNQIHHVLIQSTNRWRWGVFQPIQFTLSILSKSSKIMCYPISLPTNTFDCNIPQAIHKAFNIIKNITQWGAIR